MKGHTNKFAMDLAENADRIFREAMEKSAEYSRLATAQLEVDYQFELSIEWQDKQFEAFVPRVAYLLEAGKLDPVPARDFLARHGYSDVEVVS